MSLRKASKLKDVVPADIDEPQQRDFCPVFTSQLKHRIIAEGSDFELLCCVESRPEAQTKWFKDGCELQSNDSRFQIRFLFGGLCSLKVKECNKQDAGQYVCEAENTMGRAETRCRVHVNVEGRTKIEVNAPVFWEVLADQKVKPHSNVKLSCSVIGTPKPKIPKAEIQWYKDSEVLEGGKFHIKFKDGTCSLEMKDVTEIDVGEYRCVASNSAGLACTTAQLGLVGS